MDSKIVKSMEKLSIETDEEKKVKPKSEQSIWANLAETVKPSSINLLKQLIVAQNPRLYYNNWIKLAFGGYGQVFAATEIKTKRKVALKEIDFSYSTDSMVINEIRILKSAQHDNIVSYYGSYLSDNIVTIALSFEPNQTLKYWLINVHFNADDIAIILRDILQGLSYLHQKVNLFKLSKYIIF